MSETNNSVVNITDTVKEAAKLAAQKYDAWQKSHDAKIAARPQFSASKEKITKAGMLNTAATLAEREWESMKASLMSVAHQANPKLLPQRPMDGSGHATWQSQKASCDAVMRVALNQLLGEVATEQGLRVAENNQFFDTPEVGTISRP